MSEYRNGRRCSYSLPHMEKLTRVGSNSITRAYSCTCPACCRAERCTQKDNSALIGEKDVQSGKNKRGEHVRGIDAWWYVHHLAKPLMGTECHCQLQQNPSFVLMEDGASPRTANYRSRERQNEGIPKLPWISNCPDFNQIERIWTFIKRRIQRSRTSERVPTVAEMQVVLHEDWEKITVEDINRGIERLPTIMSRCPAVNGSNNFHA